MEVERKVYAGPADGFFDKDNFISVMKLMHAQGEGVAGSITSFKIDEVKVEYCLNYEINNPDQARITLAGPEKRVNQLEQIISKELKIFEENSKNKTKK